MSRTQISRHSPCNRSVQKGVAILLTSTLALFRTFAEYGTVEPRFYELRRDRGNVFAISKVR